RSSLWTVWRGPGAANGKNQRRAGKRSWLVCAPLAMSVESHAVTAIQSTGGSQGARRIACYDTGRGQGGLELSPQGLKLLRPRARVSCEAEDRRRGAGGHTEV